MPDLDPVRTPERPRFFRRLAIGVALLSGLMLTAEWWLQSPWPRGVIVAAIAVLVGWIVGRLVFRRKMFKEK